MNLSHIKASLANLATVGGFELVQRSARLTSLCNLFFENFGDGPVSLLRAPARINVLGEHIDYVSYLPTASLTFGSRERDALMLYRHSRDGLVRSVSTNAKYGASSFEVDAQRVPRFGENAEADWLSFLFEHGTPIPNWQNYIQGAVTFACGKFGQEIVNGFDCVIDSSIPAGGGASSSSALVVLGGAAIREANRVSFTSEELARDSAMAEWFIGTRGGSMDHTTICLARQASAVLISYSNSQIRRVKLPDEPFEWVTFFTEPADKGREVMIEYNERAAVSRLLIPAIIDNWKSTLPVRHSAWRDALELLISGSSFDAAENLLSSLPPTISIETLRRDYSETFSVLERSFPALLNAESRWPVKIQTRALHHLGEVRRVVLATRTLDSIQKRSDDTFAAMRSIGNLVSESHASLRDLYEVSTSEVEELIKIIRDDPNVLGARLMGGGFGGNVLALTTRDHSQALIQQVEQRYYAPRNRNGIREESIMVSTPGPGLTHVDLNNIWREAITHINSLGPQAASYTTNLRSLIDSSPVGFDPNEIWPVIVAAGKGTRAAETGIDVPKPVAPINQTPAILHVLRSIRNGLGATRTPVIVVSPETKPAIVEALNDEDAIFVTQPFALGTGDAVLCAHDAMHDFSGLALVVWSTQPVIRPTTFVRTAKLASLFDSYEMVVPTTFLHHPYAPIRRNDLGEVRAASETHLESAESVDFGETNIGMFLLKSQTMFQVLQALRTHHWNQSSNSYNRSRGELGFPNEVISTLAQKRNGVLASPIADLREEQGIKSLDDLARCEKFISELEQEKVSQRSMRG
jgi:galactokinase/CTP:molybdopterin cytidylyltransferase MocA